MRKTNGDDDTYGDSFDNGNVSLCCPFNYVTPETPAIQKKTRVFCSPPLHCETLDDGTAERERERRPNMYPACEQDVPKLTTLSLQTPNLRVLVLQP